LAKILALDIGLKRIGVAISLHKDVVTPLPAIERRNRKQASSDTKQLIKEWGIDKIVVGIPENGSSSDEMRRRFEHFVGLLNFNGETVFQSEELSSVEAKELMMGEIRQKRDGRIDSLSAKIVLERYLAKS
jgi:putative Holliday junction resolvase